jgi:hypothetical protein
MDYYSSHSSTTLWRKLMGDYGTWQASQLKSKIEQLDEEVLSLHRQVAAERLRADQGWQRYEAKNKECLQLREMIAGKERKLK